MTGGLWLDNANATVVGQAGSPTNNGLLRVTNGTLNVGTLGTHVMGAGVGAAFTVEGGTLNFAGRLFSANTFITYTQSGGAVNICVAGGCTTTPSFGFTGVTGVVMKMSGGAINLVNSNGLTTADYNMTGATMVYTGGTLNVGTAATVTNFNFRAQGQAPNVVVDNTTNNKTLFVPVQLNVWGNLTINPGTTLNFQANVTLLQIGPTIVNNGAIVTTTNNTGSVNFAGSQQTLGGGYAQTYTGTGTFGTPACGLILQPPECAGVTIDPSVSPLYVDRINAFYGAVTNANKIFDRQCRCRDPGHPARRHGHRVRRRQPRRGTDLQRRRRRAGPRLCPVARGPGYDRARDPDHPQHPQHPDPQPDRRHVGGRRPDRDRHRRRLERPAAPVRHADDQRVQPAAPDRRRHHRSVAAARRPAMSTVR